MLRNAAVEGADRIASVLDARADQTMHARHSRSRFSMQRASVGVDGSR